MVNFLNTHEIAYNLFLTRGKRFGQSRSDVYDTIRVFVWAREPTFGTKHTYIYIHFIFTLRKKKEKNSFPHLSLGVKEEVGFNPALCELAGHLLIKGDYEPH